MKILIVLFAFLLLFSPVDAYTLTYKVTNFNSRVGIENASIHTINATDTFDLTTDGFGFATQYEVEGEYSYNISVPLFYSVFNQLVDVTNDTIEEIELIPISTDGIIRFRWDDNTPPSLFYDRKICLFYKDNDRIEDCYGSNETVQILTNKEYYLEPQTFFIDPLMSLRGIWINRYNLIPTLGLFMLSLYVLIILFKKK